MLSVLGVLVLVLVLVVVLVLVLVLVGISYLLLSDLINVSLTEEVFPPICLLLLPLI